MFIYLIWTPLICSRFLFLVLNNSMLYYCCYISPRAPSPLEYKYKLVEVTKSYSIPYLKRSNRYEYYILIDFHAGFADGTVYVCVHVCVWVSSRFVFPLKYIWFWKIIGGCIKTPLYYFKFILFYNHVKWASICSIKMK